MVKISALTSNEQDENQQYIVELVSEKGASRWLAALSLKGYGSSLNELCDVIALRYGWEPKNIPQKCPC